MTLKRKVIIDCDPGIDDALALMLACASPELDVLGITIVAGNINANQCAENALKVLKKMDRLDIPVYLGAFGPLYRDTVIAEETHGLDGLGGVALENVESVRYQEGAVSFITETLQQTKDVSILAIGPLTNIALALENDKSAFSNLNELVVMGGSFKSHGNCSPVAEFNFWADPHAAEKVMNDLDRPITMVGLDVTRKVVLIPNYIELLNQLKNPKADFIVDITRFYLDFHWVQERTLGCVINDPLAIAYFIDPSICNGKSYYVDVVTEGKAIGMSMVDAGCISKKTPNCLVLTDVSTERFMKMFLTRLFPEHLDDIEAVLNCSKYTCA